MIQMHYILRSALEGISANRLRAALTMLGVVIGVAAIIAMLALGNGARAAVEQNFRYLGADVMEISARTHIDQGQLVPVGKILSYEDGLGLPQAVPLISRVDMSVGGQGKLRRGRAVVDLDISGVTADALYRLATQGSLQPLNHSGEEPLQLQDFLAQGRFFTPAEVLSGSEVCVLGSQTARDLFQEDDPLGELVWVNRTRCLVIGVLVPLESVDPGERNRSRPNEAAFMPISTAIRILYDDEPAVRIAARVSDEARMREAKAQVDAYLRQRHAIEKDADGRYLDDYDILTRQDVLGAQLASARTFALLLSAMALVSLVVGGIGIMNVMLVSVSERTREIGVCLAVGARSLDIVAQFLLEAVLLSLAGGLLGIFAGVAAIPLAASLNRGVAVLAPGSIPLAFGMALLVGVVFGLYPALRASRLDPIEALRYE
jgi:putative ABC transport system permease protein